MVPPLWFLEISRLWEKLSSVMENIFKSNEWRRIWVYKTFNIEIQKKGPNNSDILQNWFPPEISSPVFNLYKCQASEKITPEPCKMHWNLMNGEGFGSTKVLKSNYRRGDQIIETFSKIGSSQKLGPPCLICRNFKSLRKLLLNHDEYSEF